MQHAFDTELSICGPLRRPRQMLAAQVVGGRSSIHDDATAGRLGLKAGPIEGPTHFSQFDPLLVELFGSAWFERGCISAHYQTMVVEGEAVRAYARRPAPGETSARIWAEKADGTPVLTGTASIGPEHGSTELGVRMARLRDDGPLVILRDLKVGQRGATSPERVRMGLHQHMGELYPFTLADKLAVITEPCPWYTAEGAAGSPWRRPIIPFEMISVLLGSTSAQAGFRPRGPAVGLFAAQEIRLLAGPLFVDHPYELEREIVALSQSTRTESMWIRTRVFDGTSRVLVAEMMLASAVLKASYEPYAREAAALGRA